MADEKKKDAPAPAPSPPPADGGGGGDKGKGKEKKKKGGGDKLQKQRLVIAILVMVSVFVLAFPKLTGKYIPEFNSSVAKLYMQHIFPLITLPFSWLTDKVPMSFGEILIIAALVMIPLSLIIVIVVSAVKKIAADKKKKVRRFFGYFWAWAITYVLVTETFNCYALYNAPSFTEVFTKYPGDTYTSAQLEELAEYLAYETNVLSTNVNRDSEGKFVLTADLNDTAKASMKGLAKEYPQLKGFYTTPKEIKNSFFMSQTGLTGVYFPFTMEANYNGDMVELNLPETVCHELAHTKGFIREDEANFIAFLACYSSDDPDFRYSGCIQALKYVLNKCDPDTANWLYGLLYDGVLTDIDANTEYWKSVKESDEGVFDSEKVAEVSDKAVEASLQFGGVEDGKKSYGRMVDLLLDWYYNVK
ncbi:MAG: DUF3810 domain-containing protein [Ruminococcus sp.]|nr:DUF3810 domain-containing protein [Ruminococcus sp.]